MPLTPEPRITLKTFLWKPSSDHKATCAFLFTNVYIFNHMGHDLSYALTYGYVYKQWYRSFLPSNVIPVKVLSALWVFLLYKAWSLENITAPWGNSGIDHWVGCKEELIQHSTLIWPSRPPRTSYYQLPFFLINVSLSPPSFLTVLSIIRLSVWKHEREDTLQGCLWGTGWLRPETRHRDKDSLHF